MLIKKRHPKPNQTRTFGGMLMSGYAKYPNKRMFWSRKDVPKLLAQSMPCNRFELILRFLLDLILYFRPYNILNILLIPMKNV